MDKNAHLILLLDSYAPLLTEKQHRALSLRLEEDLTLSEIAQMEGVSRQAVSELIGKAEDALFSAEEKLGFLEKSLSIKAFLEKAKANLEKGETQQGLAFLQKALDQYR